VLSDEVSLALSVPEVSEAGGEDALAPAVSGVV
jgi:hypothetical protein